MKLLNIILYCIVLVLFTLMLSCLDELHSNNQKAVTNDDDYVYTYFCKVKGVCNRKEIDSMLKKNNTLFKEVRNMFVDYESIINPNIGTVLCKLSIGQGGTFFFYKYNNKIKTINIGLFDMHKRFQFNNGMIDTIFLSSEYLNVAKTLKLEYYKTNNMILNSTIIGHRHNLLGKYGLIPQWDYLLNMQDLVEIRTPFDIDRLKDKLNNDSIYVNCEGFDQMKERPCCKQTLDNMYVNTEVTTHIRQIKDCLLHNGTLKELRNEVTKENKWIYYTQPDFQFYTIEKTDSNYILSRIIESKHCFLNGFIK